MIINSLLDTDLYKLTMQQAVYHRFAHVEVEYTFKCRNEGVDISPFANRIYDEISHLCSLRFTDDEIEYLRSLTFFKNDYLKFLKYFAFDINDITLLANPFRLKIRGPWLNTILFETPVLSIISESFLAGATSKKQAFKEGVSLLEKDLSRLESYPGVKIADFGTRRRFSRDYQLAMLETFFNSGCSRSLVGTSNVDMARMYDIKPIGTMAHEWIMAGQALAPLHESQTFMLDAWVHEYRGDLGIALSDTLGVDAFLRDFDLYFSKLYDGVRHDSGDPITWMDKVVFHYQKHGIDPGTKSFVFSDGLDIHQAIAIYEEAKTRGIRPSFGIGTKLTNNVGVKPLNIVIKMTECNGRSVAKISDSKGKGMCKDPTLIEHLSKIFQIQ